MQDTFDILKVLDDAIQRHEKAGTRSRVLPIDESVRPYAEIVITYALGARAYEKVGVRTGARITIGDKRGFIPRGFTGEIVDLRRNVAAILAQMGETVVSTYTPDDDNAWSVTGIMGGKGDSHFKVSAPPISVSDAQVRYKSLIERVKARLSK